MIAPTSAGYNQRDEDGKGMSNVPADLLETVPSTVALGRLLERPIAPKASLNIALVVVSGLVALPTSTATPAIISIDSVCFIPRSGRLAIGTSRVTVVRIGHDSDPSDPSMHPPHPYYRCSVRIDLFWRKTRLVGEGEGERFGRRKNAGGTRGAPGSVRGDKRRALATLFVRFVFSRHLFDLQSTCFDLSLCIGIAGRIAAEWMGGRTSFFMMLDEVPS